MEIGHSINSFHPASVSPREAATSVVERVTAGHAAGIDYVQCGDHHVVAGGQYLQSIPMAARLASEVERVATLALLPLYNPLMLAEQVGTLGALADIDFWCALGYDESSFRAYDVSMGERAPRFEEALSVLRRLWHEDEVTHHGDFHDVERASVNPKVDPRICIGGSAEPAVRRAGRLGDAWVAGPAEPVDEISRKRTWFEEAGGGTLLARRDAICLPDGDRARSIAGDLLADGYRGWPADAEWVLAGDAADVAQQLDELAGVGVTEVVVRPMAGEHAVDTLETVAAARDRL